MINFTFIQNLIPKIYAKIPSDANIGVSKEGGIIENPVINPAYGTGGNGAKIIGSLMSNIFMAMIIIGVIVLVIMIIWSGIAMISAGGEKERIQMAQKRLTYAITGFIILICVFAIASFVGGFLGLDFLKTLNLPFPTAK
ncbi:MAG: hypothetical protein NT052_02250 [Candidatus Shapirobacteria bacterium]|nr:hypothetical protein [Candidatus Shapirobacteria bacterium]